MVSGSSWRNLPEEEFGPWQTIYGQYRKWIKAVSDSRGAEAMIVRGRDKWHCRISTDLRASQRRVTTSFGIAQPREEHQSTCAHTHRRDGNIFGCRRVDHCPSLQDLRREGARTGAATL